MRASDRYFLPFTAGEFHNAFEAAPQELVVTFRKFSDQILRITIHSSRANLENIVGSFDAPDADVFGGRHVAAHEILEDNANLIPQRVEVVIAKIYAIEEDLSFRWVVETSQQLCDGRFSLPIFSHESNALVRLDL